MRKIREILRLHHTAALSNRAIARSLKLSPATVNDCLARARAADLGWPLPAALSDTALEHSLYPAPQSNWLARPLPDWPTLHRELKRKGVTLMLLWQEYKADHPDGLMYSAFCDRYRAWRGQLDVVMRQDHRAGDKLFVDYAGQTVPLVNRQTGELTEAQIFVAVLGASNYTYAEATLTQTLPDFIAAHTRAFTFFGGVPNVVVPDNTKTAITAAHRYEPDVNPTYHDMANHYGVAVIPTRVCAPRDKAKVEVAVQIVERTILAVLRRRTFFSLAELNAAIAALLETLNARPFKKLPGSRQQLFETLDKPALKPLPATPYEYAEWQTARVHADYHVDVHRHYYSVPHTLIKKRLDIRITSTTVEAFYKGQRVACHRRTDQPHRHTTLPEHMPEKHRHYAEHFSPERFTRWAAHIGPATAQLITEALTERRHPEQAYRSCLGILRLAKSYGDDRLEAACARALLLGTCRYQSIASILKHRLDQQPTTIQSELDLPDHDNLRGPGYYH
jgi:transposase